MLFLLVFALTLPIWSLGRGSSFRAALFSVVFVIWLLAACGVGAGLRRLSRGRWLLRDALAGLILEELATGIPSAAIMLGGSFELPPAKPLAYGIGAMLLGTVVLCRRWPAGTAPLRGRWLRIFLATAGVFLLAYCNPWWVIVELGLLGGPVSDLSVWLAVALVAGYGIRLLAVTVERLVEWTAPRKSVGQTVV